MLNWDNLFTITRDGIIFPTYDDITERLKTVFRQIYGDDIDLEQNTLDGQLIHILSLSMINLCEVIQNIITTFDIDSSEGRALDRNVAFRGLKRKAGSYTLVPIKITTINPCILKGVSSNDPFTVADSQGNTYYLEEDLTVEEPGEYVRTFRASLQGNIIPLLNDITKIATPINGVVSVINENNVLNVGKEEEDDYELRQRFYNMTALSGSGSFEALKSFILSLDNVKDVDGEDNDNEYISIHGTPGHTVWLIVLGGDDIEIATAIKCVLNSSCGMRGNTGIKIKDLFGDEKEYRFERPEYENLYIRFYVERREVGDVIDSNYLKEQLINNLEIKLNQKIDASQINNILKNINSNLIYNSIGLSKDRENYFSYASNRELNYIFSLTKDNIEIIEGNNGNIK